MVDYNDPAIIAQDFATLVKVWHVADGLYMWEFVTSLYFEWDMFRGKHPYRWTIWVYSTSRVATLMSIILNMVGFDTTTQINCQAWMTSELFFSYLALVSSTLLIVLRVIAIWNRVKIVLVLAIAIWMIDIVFAIDAVVRVRASWSTESNSCEILNFANEASKLSTFAVLSADIMLLVIMLIGLFRMRTDTGGSFGLGRVLLKQGLIWLLIATVAEVPPPVFVILNLNVPLTMLPEPPCLIIVTIAATRMYRSLIIIGSSQILHEISGGGSGGRAVSDTRGVRSGPIIPLNRMEVTVRTERDQFPTSQSSYVSTDQGRYEAHKVNLNIDVESDPKK